MKTAIKSGNIVLPRGVTAGYVLIEDGVILSVSEKMPVCDELIDKSESIVMPGFIDIHTHGGGGFPFADSTAEAVARGCDFHLMHGTTTILPTVSASAIPSIRHSLSAIGEVMDKKLSRANVIGAHLEGPYLAPEMCGAQCTDYITEPKREDYTALVSEYGKYIARWTFAPERDENGEFASFLAEHHILGSMGHTAAKLDSVKRALESGTRLVTHLYSCTSTVTRDHGFRSAGVIESCFLLDETVAEIIADGRHLPPELIRMIIKIKGERGVIAVTDSLEVAGSGVDRGVMCGVEFIVEDRVAKLPDRSAFAGSVATADVLLKTLFSEVGVSLPTASRMLSENPALLLGLNKGRIGAGLDADLTLLDKEFNVTDVFVLGEKVK